VPKAGIFKGSWYLRQKQKDKHHNTYDSRATWRNVHSGLVANSKGNIIGVEKNHMHHYSTDPRKIKKLSRGQTRQQRAIMISLRKRGRAR